jgi:hypothetical protein
VPDGQVANHPFAVTTLRPPIDSPLPGAVVRIASIGSPASSEALRSPGERLRRIALCFAHEGQAELLVAVREESFGDQF